MDLSNEIAEKFENTQRKVIQHFDEEVRTKLKIRSQKINDMLDEFDRSLMRYIKAVFQEGIKETGKNRYQITKIPSELSYVESDSLLNKILAVGSVLDDEKREGVINLHPRTKFITKLLQEDANKKDLVYKLIFKHDVNDKRNEFHDIQGQAGLLRLDKVICKRKTINDIVETFEKVVFTCLLKKDHSWAFPTTSPGGNGWSLFSSYRSSRLVNLNVVDEKEDTLDTPEFLNSCVLDNIEKAKQEFTEENESFIDKMTDQLNKYSEEVLLRFKREMEDREEEMKALERSMRGSKTLGFHERREIQGEIDKKQRQYAQAVKKHAEAQIVLFKEKDKKLNDLLDKLTLSFETMHIATVSFTIQV
jgi:hypothetical protein